VIVVTSPQDAGEDRTTFGIIGSILSRMRAWRARKASVTNLRWLDDRILADIGLRCDEIPLLAAACRCTEMGTAPSRRRHAEPCPPNPRNNPANSRIQHRRKDT
jgi:uncharacterized protein YjiS (DUF1127 family)